MSKCNGPANFGANLAGADLCNANLAGATLAGTDLRSALIAGVDLSEADRGGDNLGEADLTAAEVWRRNLEGCVIAPETLHTTLNGRNP